MTTKKVSELKKGDHFKWDLNQKKYRQVFDIIPVPESETLPEHYKGGLIIVLDNCKTITLQPSAEVVIED
ncbi:hypothetical protein [Flavobacterium denitrificans]|uniref:hypothetical protein n=1 Tax=Flavobacterium denitrificans TaxID=281361 RepID=UPI0012F95A1B|nr:hypothetical protein [Flavobacterium denitrificans]